MYVCMCVCVCVCNGSASRGSHTLAKTDIWKWTTVTQTAPTMKDKDTNNRKHAVTRMSVCNAVFTLLQFIVAL